MAQLAGISSGSSNTLTVADGQTIVLVNGRSDVARLTIATGPGAGRVVTASHNGRNVYGPFGVGTITLAAVIGDLRYELSGDATSQLTDDDGPLNPTENVLIRTLMSGAAVVFAGAATDNTLSEANRVSLQAMQDALEAAGGGTLMVLTPGLVHISRAILLGDNVHLYIGQNSTLRLRDNADPLTNTGYCVVGNKQAFASLASATTLAEGNITWGNSLPGDANTYHGTITNAVSPGITAKHPLGSYISVIVMGHFVTGTYAAGTALRAEQCSWFRGVYKVAGNDGSAVRYATHRWTPPGSGINRNTSYAFRSNVNIKVFGPGAIDGNGANQAFTNDITGRQLAAGNPRACVIMFRHVFDLCIKEIQFKRGVTWTVCTNYVRKYRVSGIRGDVRDPSGGSSIDGLHMAGQHQDVVIDIPEFFSQDNLVGMTQDITDDTANAANGGAALTYNFDFQHPGDQWDVQIRRVGANTLTGTSSGIALVAFWGAPGYRFFAPQVDCVVGYGGPAVSISNYDATGLTLTTIDTLTVNNLNSHTSGPQILLNGNMRIESIVQNGMRLNSQGPVGQALQCTTTTWGSPNVRKLVMGNIVLTPSAGTTFIGRTTPLIDLGNASIGEALFHDIPNMMLNTDNGGSSVTNVSLVTHGGSGTVGAVMFERVHASCAPLNATSLTTTSALYSTAGSTVTAGPVTFTDCSFTGVNYLGTLYGSMYRQGSAALYPNVTFNNPTISTAAALYIGTNTSATVNLEINNFNLAGVASTRVADLTGNVNVFLNGYRETTTPVNNPFRTPNAANTYVFRAVNNARAGDLVEKGAASIVRAVGSTETRIDGDKITVGSAVLGDTFWNTNAASTFGTGTSKIGFYHCTVAGTTFAKAFGPS